MKESVVFFGSGPVAAESLRLLAENFNIEVVVTKPKPTHHRGNFPVLDLVKQLNLHVKTVINKNELDELMSSKPFDSKLGVIIDFGIIVSRKVIDYFPLGIVNSHFSLLPEWRGADPITFSILSGQPKTGVSLMLIDEGLDTGKLLTYKTLPIEPMDTTQSLTDRLIKLSDKLLQDYLPKYVIGSIKPKNQPHPDRATYSRKLTKEDGIIDWNKSAQQIEREIRAYIEWPKSRTKIADKEIIITKAHALPTNIPNNPIGKFEAVGNALMVECGKGTLCIDRLKPAGKSEMTAMAFLAGYKNLINQ